MTTLRSTLTLVESAVLAPIYRDPQGRLRLVFIRRSPHGIHGGQIAFPGGRWEPHDADLLATALREAEEEVGLDPAMVEILTELPVIETMATGFRVTPFLGRRHGRESCLLAYDPAHEQFEIDLASGGHWRRAPFAIGDERKRGGRRIGRLGRPSFGRRRRVLEGGDGACRARLGEGSAAASRS